MRISVDQGLQMGLALERAQQLRNGQNLPGTGNANALRATAEEFETL